MKNLLLLLVFAWASVNAQEQIRQDSVLIGKPSTANDKVLSFDTADGASNPKLSVEKVSKKLKYDQNTFQLGGASATDNKDIIFNGDNKKIRYDGTANELQYDGDLLSVGDGTNTNKSFKFNKGASSPSIRYNSTTGKLEFSNDNASFKAIGSGSGAGSGINILLNASFEDPLTDGWNNSGGTFTQQPYTNPTESNTKFARFVASGAGQYVETDLTVVPDFLGAGCQAQFEKYATVTDGAWKIVVLDASSNVLATQNFNQSGGASTFISTPLLSFPCPLAAATFKLRIESLAAATIDFDLAYGGGNKNTVDIAQARNAGSAVIPVSASCIPTRANSAYGDFPALAACLGPTINFSSIGTWLTTDTDLPQVTINNLPAGRYVVLARHTLYNTTGGSVACARLSDGTTNGEGECVSVPASEISSVTLKYDVSYSTAGNRTFKIQGKAAAGSVNIYNDANYGGIKFDVFYYPDDSQTAVTSEQSGWFIDANIGGANASIGVAAVTSYTEITNATLDLVINTNSASAKIPCSTTNPATGLTCAAGSEGLGVVFTPPYAGWFDVCMNTSHQISVGASGVIETTLQLVETTPSTQTIIQEGKQRNQARVGSGASTTNTYDRSTCGSFYFSSVTEKTIRLMFEQQATGSVASSAILADRSANDGQRDIRVTVRPSTMNMSRPVLTGDQVTAPGQTSTKKYALFVDCNVSSSILFETMIGTPSIGNMTGGVCTVTIPSGNFTDASKMDCKPTLTGSQDAQYTFLRTTHTSTTSINIQCGRYTGAVCLNFQARYECTQW